MRVSKKIILDLCGGTGSWSQYYSEDSNYNVIVVDPQKIVDSSIAIDVRLFEYPDYNVHGILCAPPCTEFAGSGARWWKEKGIKPLMDGLSIVDACLRIVTITKPEFWALENPVGRLRRYLGDPTLIFNPCDYGDPYTKKTLLWGNFNIPEQNPVEPEFVTYKNGKRGSKFWAKLGGKSVRTKRLRSITPKGFAKAFYKSNQ
jgi:hypothetical protein